MQWLHQLNGQRESMEAQDIQMSLSEDILAVK